MANIKFSGFTEVTSISGVQEIVGYNGTQNVRITPANLLSSLPGGPFLPLAGGTMTGDLLFDDGVVAKFGTGQDLRIQSIGDQGYIQNYTGHLHIVNLADDKDILFRADDGSGGIETYFFLDGSAGGPSPFTVFPDSSTLCFGTSYDLRQYHNGTDSYLDNYEGNLNLRNYADDKDIVFSCDDGAGGVVAYLTLDGSHTRININATNGMQFMDNIKAKFGTSGDLEIYHDTSHSYVKSGGTGDLYIQQFRDDGDIVFQSDDGAGGVATYFYLDGGGALTRFDKRLRMSDAVGLQLGSSGNFEMYHLNSNTTMDNFTGNLTIRNSADAKDISFACDDGAGGAVEYFRVDGGITKTVFVRDTKHLDANKALFGDQDDLQIYHDGSNSYIKETGTGTLNLQGSTQVLISGTNGEVGVQYVENAGVGLRHNNVTKLTTESTGINVTGKINLSDGQNNVLIGTSAGANITTGSSNTLIGDVAGDALTTGNNNVTLGYSSLSAETAGDRSVAIGNFALQVQNNTINTDAYNTAVGYAAGASVTTAQKNTLIGGLAGDAMTTGGDNVAVGYSALSSQTVANTNVAIGVSAMATNVAADRNVAVGHEALLRMTSASSADHYNVALGYNAGREVTTGTKNTILGGLAGDAMNTGVDNVALGYKALSADQGGARSTAIGSNALASQVVASSGNMYNTALGFGAGQSVTGASQNTFIGALAGGSATSGTNNTVIGALAEKSAITAANEITLGNSSIATLRCQVTSITALSDERDKTSIEDLPYGLDFVNSLQPKKFVWDHRAETRVETDEEGNETQVEFYSSNKGKKDIGFIAQELQSVDNEFTQLVYNSNPEKLQATYGRLVPVLVKAIQDLSAKVTALENA